MKEKINALINYYQKEILSLEGDQYRNPDFLIGQIEAMKEFVSDLETLKKEI